MGHLIPSGEERRLLGRFYWATLLAELAHLAMPFQVLLVVRYLGLPQLGILLGIEQLVALSMEIPTSAWADRFGRKRCVLAGHILAALGWLSIPPATALPADFRLLAMGASFGLLGAGAALVSGALEAWVVDNLYAHGRKDLVVSFFGRERSLAATGGIGADLVALVVLGAMVDVRVFWIASGIGELVAFGILWTTPEYSPTDQQADAPGDSASEPAVTPRAREALDADDEEVGIRDAVKRGFGIIAGRPALLACTLALVWLAMSFGTGVEAFQAALAAGDLSERGFAGMELGVDGIGVIAPLLAIWLAQRFGSRPLLALGVLVSGAIALSIWRQPGLVGVTSAYLLVVACGDILHTVADDYQHQLIPSSARATASSAINLLTSIATLISTGWLTFLLAQLTAAQAVAVMGLVSLPAAVFLIPKSSKAQICPRFHRVPS